MELTNVTSKIYADLADHQRAEDWDLRDSAASCLSWIKRFNTEFKLQVFEVALRFERLPVHVYSQFRSGHNGFGLRGEITLNTAHLARRKFGLILVDLAHELIHAWQHEHGRPADRGRHNRQYRSAAAACGLTVDEKGATRLAADGPFVQLVEACGISLPQQSEANQAGSLRPRVAGNSKLAKWICSCPRPVSVRVASADFRAMCLDCGFQFRKAAMDKSSEGLGD